MGRLAGIQDQSHDAHLKLNSEEWAQAVENGRVLALEQRINRWAIADLAVDLFPSMGTSRLGTTGRAGGAGQGVLIQRWLDETGLEYTVSGLRKMRFTAERWPSEKRIPTCSFACHEVLSSKEDRFEVLEPGMTMRQARALTEQPRATDYHYASVADSLRFLDASVGFIGSALKALGDQTLSDQQLEALGVRVAHLEIELEVLLERLDMAEVGGLA